MPVTTQTKLGRVFGPACNTIAWIMAWALLSIMLPTPKALAEPLNVKSNDSIVFLGNTFAERLQLFGYFETFLHSRFPDHRFRIRNLVQVVGAKEAWAKEFHKQPFDIPLPEDLFGHDKDIRDVPICPAGGVLSLGRVDEHPTCTVIHHNIGSH